MHPPHKARKRFGQNFLCDLNIIEKILAAIAPHKDDHIVEIGPGLGAITGPLLRVLDRLSVIELDRDLASTLQHTYGDNKKLLITEGDVLNFNFDSLFQGKKLRIVGNLPYNITTPLLFHLFKFTPIIQDMHFMLQKEVVERLVAAPNTKSFGRLTVMAHYFCDATELFTVGPEAFRPTPKVNSAVVRLTPHVYPKEVVNNFSLLQTITTAAFNQRRKTLSNALGDFLKLQDFDYLKIDPKKRPENLCLEDYINITNFIEQKAR
jgi:16S rRNA (adenine1518-N6/adenine1519-N6)-dimethyltransferase